MTVLASGSRGGAWEDASLLRQLPDGLRVERAIAPQPGPALRRLFRRRSGGEGGRRRGGDTGPLRRRLRDFVLTWMLVPDAHAPWIPFAIAKARRLVHDLHPTALLTAGPPHSAHLVGLGLRSHVERWVVDCQDPWADYPLLISESSARRAIDRWLETRVFRAADVVVSATDAQTDHFRRVHGSKVRFETVYSGYDESEFGRAEPRRTAVRSLVHIGSLYRSRSPAAFLEALREVARQHPSTANDLEVLFAGYADPASEGFIRDAQADPLLEGIVKYRPVVPRQEAIGLMLGADGLILFTDPGGGGRDLVPIKTFEYLRAGRPILALVPDGETARILGRTGGALIAHPSRVDEIGRRLRQLLQEPDTVGVPDQAVVRTMEFGRGIDRLSRLLMPDPAGARC